ncbi:hypothetical protein F5879DRAFT_999583 [Lentinula edodes]|uniref:uncharacterized protein n=1 Tax=Lentinula edodes TaxID=5353 RepID=UPI001E8E36AA|nr:uncharacterized protein C8R40DRAFT_1164901 [Lentinula edodes]KAH7881480.1 hypothetical protein C8R40DRAFT_1164901 [Lentinula edodes]KAJ3907318.1 hypothetical protein F5879DRAFT_999583 [Lentinula edodes]
MRTLFQSRPRLPKPKQPSLHSSIDQVLTPSFHTSTQSQSPSSEMDAFNTIATFFTTSAAVEDVVVEIPRDEEDSGSGANSSCVVA